MALLGSELLKRFAISGQFARLWLAVGTSNLADGMNVSAATPLAASFTRGPVLVAGLSVGQRLPWFFFSILTGALADRMDRRRAPWLANVVRATSLGILALALEWSSLLLYLAFFLIGVAETLFDNASFAILPSAVGKGDLEKTNSRLFATTTVTNELLGPHVGGFLLVILTAIPFLLGSGFYAASAVLVLMLRGRYRPEAASSAATSLLWQNIAEGFGWFCRHTLLRMLSLLAGAANLASGAAFAILVLFAQERLGLGEAGYGLLLAAGSIGGVVGGVSAGWLATRPKPSTLILVTNLLLAGSYLSIGIVSSAMAVVVLLAFIGFVVTVQNIVIASLRQKVIPDALLGRVTSAYRMIAITGSPLGALLGGLAAKRFRLGSPYLLSGIFLAVVALLILPVVNNRVIQEAHAKTTLSA